MHTYEVHTVDEYYRVEAENIDAACEQVEKQIRAWGADGDGTLNYSVRVVSGDESHLFIVKI
jgi:hypothetical protein